MRRTKQHILGMLILFLALMGQKQVAGQGTSAYTNSWISYGKPYVKIGVTKRGIHKVSMASLPKEFTTASADKLQLWHRGRQVSIISVSTSEIQFFGVPNDGATDSLLYRPMSSRMNPYYSMFSDESSYFLTIGDSAGLRAKVSNETVDTNVPGLASHDELVTTLFQTEYSLTTLNSIRQVLLNSFFEIGVSKTGKVTLTGTTINNDFTLKNFVGNIENAKIKLMIHGRSNNDRTIEVYVGKDASSTRLAGSFYNSGFAGSEYSFNLKSGDVDDAKKGVLVLKTVSSDKLDRFSLAYFNVSFPQSVDMTGQTTKEFTLTPSKTGLNRIQIKGLPSKPVLLDVSDADVPIVLNGSGENYMVSGQQSKKVRLFASNETTTVASAKIKSVTLNAIETKQPNFIIITSASLTDGASKYAAYRSSADGGGYRPIVLQITDLYDQFNYGEPSPVAIRRFMAYMLGEGGKDKSLFLIGKSITFNERIKKELPEEVPTIGYPGSDVLLVEGLAGAKAEVPAVPVGRLPALSNQHVLDYLEKVKEYEHNAVGDIGWRKNVLHLNGGKNTGEITQLKTLLSNLVPDVVQGVVGGKVTPFVKQQPISEVETVNITPEVNAGVGLITYFGHGSPIVTDLDMGYITDVPRGYNNYQKYPMMYFNGCGVGNIFSGRVNASPSAPSGDRITLSLDWIIAPGRGSVAVIANSFESFVSPSAQYLQELYKHMFIDPSTVNLSIGKIQQAVANTIISQASDKYTLANLHQSLLQGDPVLKLVTVSNPDYAVSSDESITLYSKSANKTINESDSVKVEVVIANKGRYVKDQPVTVEIGYVGKATVTKSVILESFAYYDTIMVSFPNGRDLEKITVSIDPKHLLNEMDLGNNLAELDVNWDSVKDLNLFSSANNKDVIPPVLSVKLNNNRPKDNEQLSPNPTINVTLRDDRLLLADTALVEIYLKRCKESTCEFEKQAYAAADISLEQLDNYSFRINYPTKGLGTGEYELLVNAKDRAGNFGLQPYQIAFTIGEVADPIVKLVASPNPATTFVRFELSDLEISAQRVVKYSIYNLTGVLVEEKEIKANANSAKLEWYWTPSHSFPAGLYSYKVAIYGDQNQKLKQLTGKVVVTK